MRYMMLVYSNETELDPEALREVAAGHRRVMSESAAAGVFRGAEKLNSTGTATTVRIENGAAVVTDGPFAETKEQLAGYYILDCSDLDEAIQWAAKIPTGCQGAEGCIEIRPIFEMHERGNA